MFVALLLQREIGEKQSESMDLVRQLLPLPKQVIEVIQTEPHRNKKTVCYLMSYLRAQVCNNSCLIICCSVSIKRKYLLLLFKRIAIIVSYQWMFDGILHEVFFCQLLN